MTTLASAYPASPFGPIATVLEHVASFFDSLSRAVRASRKYEMLVYKSDAELQRMGLTRQDIPHYVAKTVLNIG